jgi:MiaB-like tRNA modifying enzyme
MTGRSIDSIVPISTGCKGKCSYCITRLARGELQSYSEEKILKEISSAVALGKLEIRLTAQDTGCYGLDSNTNLAELINHISLLKTKSEFRLRVGMMNPDSVRPILDSVIRSYEKARVFKFLHVPVQSGDDGILRAMGRSYSVSEFLKILKDFRAHHQKLTVSTDIIVGYPGESDEQFSRSLELIRKLKPNIVNITRFSPRPGTPAGRLKSKLTGSQIKDRSRRLTELRFGISNELNKGELGEEYRVLVTERVKKGTVLCRNDNYLPIVVKQVLPLSTWQYVHVIDATDSYVIGEVVK